MIHDLDESLRNLIRLRMESDATIDVVFDAPTKDWASRRNAPTVDLYLYDIREDPDRRETGQAEQRSDDGRRILGWTAPPRWFKLSYLVTAWTQRPEDEHRLLSMLLQAFLAQDGLPEEVLAGSLAGSGLPVTYTCALPPPQDRALSDTWSALGGELKPSLDLVVTAPFNLGRVTTAGPPVTEPLLLGVVDKTEPDVDKAARDVPRMIRRFEVRTPAEPAVAQAASDSASPADVRPATAPARRRRGPGPCRGHGHGQAAPAPEEEAGEWLSVTDEPSRQDLLHRLEALNEKVRAAVDRRQQGDPNPSDPFRGMHISDEQARVLLAEPLLQRDHGSGPAGVGSPDDRSLADASGDGHVLRLRRLAVGARLDELDVDLLLVALAPDLDQRIERAYGYLHDDLTRRRASIGLALELAGGSGLDTVGRSRLSGGGQLVRFELITVEDADRPFLTRSLRVPDAVAAFLLGDDALDPLVVPHTERLSGRAGRAGQDTEVLDRSLAAGVAFVQVLDRRGVGAASWAARGLWNAGLTPLALDLRSVAAADDPAGVIAAARRHVVMSGGALVAGPVTALAARGPDLVRRLTAGGVVVVVVDDHTWDPSCSERVPLTLVSPSPSAAGAVGAGSVYRLTPEQEDRAMIAAELLAVAEGSPPTPSHFAAGVRAQNAAGLERLAVRIEPRAGWDDLVVPGDLMTQLRAASSHVRHRDQVMREWGMDRGASKGQGVTALFAGASGTGKTLAAEVIAGDLGLDLYVIDLASVVDKYIGETEKNLDRIFAEADRVNGVLLFDEADAIFGKRSEVQDAHDRHANIEVAYLLQRMERFEGVALLTTNLRANIDEAFLRRLDVLVDFPTPDAVLRESLWRRHLPASLPQDDSIDLAFLATSFDLTGGNISSVAMTAAFLAAANGHVVTMEHVIHATAREYRKLGRMCSSSEFGPWFAAIRELQAG